MPQGNAIAMDVQACLRGSEVSIHQMTVGPPASELKKQKISLHFDYPARKSPVQISAKQSHDVPHRLTMGQVNINFMLPSQQSINLCARRRPSAAWRVLGGWKGYQVNRTGQRQTNYELERLRTGAITRDVQSHD